MAAKLAALGLGLLLATVALVGQAAGGAFTAFTDGIDSPQCPPATGQSDCQSNREAAPDGSCGDIHPPNSTTETAIRYACSQLGLPYIWGGDGPAAGDAGFDCSGLTTAAYAAAGVDLPRTAHTQYLASPPADQPLRPGDLVFYGTPTKVHHVGLYIGAGLMIHAPTFGQPVQVAAYRWGQDDYLAARRPSIFDVHAKSPPPLSVSGIAFERPRTHIVPLLPHRHEARP